MKVMVFKYILSKYFYIDHGFGVMESTDEDIEAEILHKLAKRRLWGPKHTDFEHLKNGFKTHLHGRVEKLATKLIKQNLIIRKPASYGLQVSLNFNERETIYNKIDVYLKKKM